MSLSGYGSFCCDSPAATVSAREEIYEQRLTHFPQNEPRVSDFSKRLEDFANNPTCGKDDRLSLNAKREEKNIQLSKRHDLSKSDWSDLLMQITALAVGTARTYQMKFNGTRIQYVEMILKSTARPHA